MLCRTGSISGASTRSRRPNALSYGWRSAWPPGTHYALFVGNPALPHKRFALARAAVAHAAQRSAFALELIPLAGRPQDEIVRYMQAADLLLMTSSQEGSPNVVKEAMAAGLAVVAVDIGDTGERLAGVRGCRIAASDRPEDVGAAIADVLGSDEPRDGRRAVEPLRLEAVAARIVSIYEQVLGGT